MKKRTVGILPPNEISNGDDNAYFHAIRENENSRIVVTVSNNLDDFIDKFGDFVEAGQFKEIECNKIGCKRYAMYLVKSDLEEIWKSFKYAATKSFVKDIQIRNGGTPNN